LANDIFVGFGELRDSYVSLLRLAIFNVLSTHKMLVIGLNKNAQLADKQI